MQQDRFSVIRAVYTSQVALQKIGKQICSASKWNSCSFPLLSAWGLLSLSCWFSFLLSGLNSQIQEKNNHFYCCPSWLSLFYAYW